MMPHLRILLVEDSGADARLIRELLGTRQMQAEFTLEWSDTLESAMVKVRDSPPDVILLDLSLPDSDGLGSFRKVHARFSRVPIVVLTVLEDQELAITAVGEGAQDYLIKGQVNAYRLSQALRYAVERQRLMLELRQAKEAAETRNTELSAYSKQMEAAFEQLGEAVRRERESLQRMQELDNLKNEFLSLFAHDLRNGTHVIKSFSELLVGRWERLPESKRRMYASTVLRGCANLTKLIENVLQYARIEEGSFMVDVHPLDLQHLVASTVDDLMGPESKAPIKLSAPPELPLVLADERRQWQVLTNLISNAQKFSPPGAPIEVELSHREAEGLVQVRIRDHGRGVAAEDISKLFRKFSRVGRERGGLEPVPGTGLGLYICKKLVEAQGGTIWVESEPGKGSVFTYTVPVATPRT